MSLEGPHSQLTFHTENSDADMHRASARGGAMEGPSGVGQLGWSKLSKQGSSGCSWGGGVHIAVERPGEMQKTASWT